MKTVVALYDQISDANAAVRDLVDFGIPRDNISLMASDASGSYSTYFSGQRSGEAVNETVEGTASGAATGAGIGAIVGGLGGLLVGLGVLAVPGVGPVLAAGPLATAISAIAGAGVGAMAGGAAGGLIGALVDLGLPEETAGNYAEGVRRGGTLVTVRTEDHQAEEVRRIMNRHNVVNLDERVRGWRGQGWAGYHADQDVNARDREYQTSSTSVVGGMAQDVEHGVRHTGQEVGGMAQDVEHRVTDAARDMRDTARNIGREAREMGRDVADEMTPTTGDLSGREASPYAQDAPREEAIHPEGGMYGGVNAPDESGHTPAGDFRDRGHTGYRSEMSGSASTGGVSSYNSPGSGVTRHDWDNDERWRHYDSGFQSHYTSTFAGRGHDYDYYRPAYYYGYQLAGDERYRGWEWNDIEPEARRDWESRNRGQGAWEDFKDAVRYSWQRVKEGVRETFD